MEYTSWNTKTIKKQLASLRDDENCSLDYDVLTDILNQDITPFYQPDSFAYRIESDYDIDSEYFDFIKDIKTFSKIKRNHNLSNPLYLDEMVFSNNELINFVYDFFSTKDPEWLKLFDEIYVERQNNLQFNDERSNEIYIPSINYNYINICKTDSIEDVFGIVHEYTHAIVDRMKYRFTYDCHYPFIELPSLLMELIAKDEIAYTYCNSEVQVKIYMLATIRTMLKHAKNIGLEHYYFRKIETFKSYKATVNEMSRLTHKNRDEIESLLNFSNLERFMYVIPMMVAIELYYMYKEDPEKCFSMLNYLIHLENVYTYKSILDSNGIELNSHTDEFIREIKRS